ncbi:MAG TPA: hypothetical protein VFI73_09495 [Candidatus Nitrosopolaris sp.]|nr:hypothetical protein [Candidatus Nitrosopolaris sp.]
MLALCFAILVSQYTTIDVLPFHIKEAKAIKHITSYSASPPPSNQGNTGSSSPRSNIASPSACINYDPSKRTITTSCSSARLTDRYKLHDSSILAKESTNGVCFIQHCAIVTDGEDVKGKFRCCYITWNMGALGTKRKEIR